jgi:Alternative complex III, ActD subunit
MTVLYALYESPKAAGRAIAGLRAAGVADSEVTIQSSEPFGPDEPEERTWMPWIAVLGGTVGLGSGIALTSLTQLDWPLVSGGMPIVSIWPDLIPTFELTMLGAVLATIGTFVVTALLGGGDRTIYDPAVSEGKILVGVVCEEDAPSAELERVLGREGRIRRLR